jgi:cation diffusion facilitator family transporter
MFESIRDWFGFSAAAMADHSHRHGHHHQPGHHAAPHGHTHGVVDSSIATTEIGVWAVKWSFAILVLTAALQMGVVVVSGSVALLADTIHNVADATTAIPLWIAFVLARRKPSATFTYGLGRVEDLAGLAVVGIILFSALVAGYEAIQRFVHPQPITALAWVAMAGVIGFIGNEAVAVFRIRVGRRINSAALIADGFHARTDGLTSLAVVLGALGVWLGFPLADPIIGLVITLTLFGIVWQSSRAVLIRMLDGVDPGIIREIRQAAEHVEGVTGLGQVQARWLGHQLYADVAIRVDDAIQVAAARRIAAEFRRQLFGHLPALADARIRLGSDAPGSAAHGADGQEH